VTTGNGDTSQTAFCVSDMVIVTDDAAGNKVTIGTGAMSDGDPAVCVVVFGHLEPGVVVCDPSIAGTQLRRERHRH